MSDLDKAPQGDCFITSRLWRGQEHFVVYWIAILLGAPYWSAAYKHLALVKGSIGSLLLWVGLCGYFLVLYVGLWRAASRYAGRKRWASRIKHLFGLAAAVALLVGGANRSDTERRLVGTWHMDTEGTAFEMTLGSDHSYFISGTGRANFAGNGRWALRGGQLVMQIGTNPIQRASITTLEGTNLVMHDVLYDRRLTWSR